MIGVYMKMQKIQLLRGYEKTSIQVDVSIFKSNILHSFIGRETNTEIERFIRKEGDKINTRVIGIRYELNDKYISIMSELLEDKLEKYAVKKKPKLSIIGDV